MNLYNNIHSRGSSLIGMALLVTIVGALLTGGIYLYQNYDLIQSEQKTVDHTKVVQAALKDFVAREGRLPMPAPLTEIPDSNRFGTEQASGAGVYQMQGRVDATLGRDGIVLVGAVPTRVLNIPDKVMFDGKGKRYVYAVTRDMTGPTADASNDSGAITIRDENGNSVSDVEGYIGYALISMGEDDRGAFDQQGNLIAPCTGSGAALQNCIYQTAALAPAEFLASGQKKFGVGDDSFTHSFAFQSNAVPFRWASSVWSDCSGVCFSGTQDRAVTCVNNKNETVDDSFCTHTVKPEEGPRNCGLPPCYWDIGAYGSCSASNFSTNTCN